MKIDEIYNFVDKKDNGCWEWTRHCIKNGYGRVWIEGKMKLAHRMSYQLTYGDFDQSLMVLHKCDNRKCCNPVHLVLGTHTDNMRDKKERGGGKIITSGELHNRARLTWEQVDKIRLLLKTTSRKDIASMFNATMYQIHDIALGRSWQPNTHPHCCDLVRQRMNIYK